MPSDCEEPPRRPWSEWEWSTTRPSWDPVNYTSKSPSDRHRRGVTWVVRTGRVSARVTRRQAATTSSTWNTGRNSHTNNYRNTWMTCTIDSRQRVVMVIRVTMKNRVWLGHPRMVGWHSIRDRAVGTGHTTVWIRRSRRKDRRISTEPYRARWNPCQMTPIRSQMCIRCTMRGGQPRGSLVSPWIPHPRLWLSSTARPVNPTVTPGWRWITRDSGARRRSGNYWWRTMSTPEIKPQRARNHRYSPNHRHNHNRWYTVMDSQWVRLMTCCVGKCSPYLSEINARAGMWGRRAKGLLDRVSTRGGMNRHSPSLYSRTPNKPVAIPHSSHPNHKRPHPQTHRWPLNPPLPARNHRRIENHYRRTSNISKDIRMEWDKIYWKGPTPMWTIWEEIRYRPAHSLADDRHITPLVTHEFSRPSVSRRQDRVIVSSGRPTTMPTTAS